MHLQILRVADQTMQANMNISSEQKLLETSMSNSTGYTGAILPAGIRSRLVHNINGLTMHVLEAGFEQKNRPCVLLLHGFPELAYSWRKIMLPLAAAGFHVLAPDQRGYGRTTGWSDDYDGDISAFRMLNLVKDALSLVYAFGYHSVNAVIGHDFGSPVAAYCALVRPDVFHSVVLMSAPFGGPPPLLFDTINGNAANDTAPSSANIHNELAALERPRKHYQWYYSTRAANADMQHCPQGLHNFLRAYYHCKSSDWEQNQPFPLKSWSAGELAKMPTYYIMDLAKNMAETVATEMPSAAHIAACQWLTDDELRVYSTEFNRTGFQGGLQWYRCMTDSTYSAELQLFSDRTIDVPSCFIAGNKDWGIYQKPGDLEKMQNTVCTKMHGCYLVDNAGHWVQQEQPETVSRLITEFLQARKSAQ